MNQAIVAYVPVLHQGYLHFFAKYPEVKNLYLLEESLTHRWRSLQKDLRALPAQQMQIIINSLNLFKTVTLVTEQNIDQVLAGHDVLIMPDEELNHQLAGEYFQDQNIIFDTIFLRWDRARSFSHEEFESDVEISQNNFDQKILTHLGPLAQRSSDWWRQTAAAIVKDSQILVEVKNSHVPFDQQHYIDGDPRADFGSGEHVDLSSSLHAEGAAVVEAARLGIKTAGCEMYATTFPCPYCAPLVAAAGITTLYYQQGYSLIRGAEMLRAKGVRLVKVIRTQ